MCTGSGLCKKEVGWASGPHDHYVRVVNVGFACRAVHTVILTICLSSMPVTPMTWLRCVTHTPLPPKTNVWNKLIKVASTHMSLTETDASEQHPIEHSGRVVTTRIRESHLVSDFMAVNSSWFSQHWSSKELETGLCFKRFFRLPSEAWSSSHPAYKLFSSTSH